MRVVPVHNHGDIVGYRVYDGERRLSPLIKDKKTAERELEKIPQRPTRSIKLTPTTPVNQPKWENVPSRQKPKPSLTPDQIARAWKDA